MKFIEAHVLMKAPLYSDRMKMTGVFMECFLYFGQSGCEFNAHDTKDLLLAIFTSLVAFAAVFFGHYLNKNNSSIQQREQAQRIKGLADLVYQPICELLNKLNTENFDTETYRRDTFKLIKLRRVADELDQLRSIDCPSADLIKPLREFSEGLRGFLNKIESIKYFFHGQNENTRMSLLYDLEPFTKILHYSYSEMARALQKYYR